MPTMVWRDAHERIALALLRFQRETGASDAQIAAAVRAIVQSKQIPAGPTDPGHRDALYRLAWLLFVRAPALRATYLALAPMALELVAAGQRPLGELLEDMRALEAGMESADAEGSGLHRLPPRGSPKDVLSQSAAQIDRIADLDGTELRTLVDAPLARLRKGDDAFDDLAAEAADGLLDELPDVDERGMLSPSRAWASPAAIDAQMARAYRALDAGELARAAAAFERVLELAPLDWPHRERVEAIVQDLLDELFRPEA